MVNRAFDLSARAANLRFEHPDARFQLLDGERVEILLGEHHQRIARRLGQQIVEIHGEEG